MSKLKEIDHKCIKTYSEKKMRKAQRWRDNKYTRLLTRRGWTVMPPGTADRGDKA